MLSLSLSYSTAVSHSDTKMNLFARSSQVFGFRNLANPRLLRISACNASTSPSFQASSEPLPHLPVPPLSKTLEKYLKSVTPHLTEKELATTKSIVKDFAAQGGVGEKLQHLLEKRASCTENWLADWWLHSAYLDFRWPVVVYSNPGLIFPFQTFRSKDDQLRFTAKLILAAMDYKKLVDNDQIPLERMGKEPLDMGQYKKIFGTTRIPGLKRDTLSFNNSKHITVIHNNHIFSLPVVSDDGTLLNQDQIFDQLRQIVSQSQDSLENPVGILTSENRDTWGQVYQELSRDSINKNSLKLIEQSLFVVCLDKAAGEGERRSLAAAQTIHGGGSSHNSANRWFDKTIQFVVCEDGVNGMTYEHSPAEGQPIAVLLDHIADYLVANKSEGVQQAKAVSDVTRLNFNVTANIANAIKEAKTNMDKLVSDLELNCFKFEMYGKDFIKSQKLSPDSFIQMAMQLAFYRLHKVPGAHYESAATRKYIGGRTETIRSCSVESINFAKTMLDFKASVSDKVKALQEAIKAHKDYSVQAVNGFGVDRHLLGLKLIAIENGIELPKIYSDAGFVKSAHMRLSTSQVASRCDAFMCYGPLVPDGYSTCYNPRPRDINFGTAAFKSNKETSSVKYKEALEQSLVDMHNILLQSTKSKL